MARGSSARSAARTGIKSAGAEGKTIRKLLTLWTRFRYPWLPNDIIKNYPNIRNFFLAMKDLALEEGITVPLVEYGVEEGYYIIRIRHPTTDGLRLSPEVPVQLIIDPEVWVHELTEVTIRELLHTKFQDDCGEPPEDQRVGDFYIFGYVLDGFFHPVAHILPALFTVSDYNYKLISPEEYAE